MNQIDLIEVFTLGLSSGQVRQRSLVILDLQGLRIILVKYKYKYKHQNNIVQIQCKSQRVNAHHHNHKETA